LTIMGGQQKKIWQRDLGPTTKAEGDLIEYIEKKGPKWPGLTGEKSIERVKKALAKLFRRKKEATRAKVDTALRR